MAQQGDFNFQAFNGLTNGKPAGLQVFLAMQLLANAVWSMEMFDNPLASDAKGIHTELKLLRASMKQAAADRAKKLD